MKSLSIFYERMKMCGRFVLLTDLSNIIDSFDIQDVACDNKTGNNISPAQHVTAVVHDGKNSLVNFRRGLIPWFNPENQDRAELLSLLKPYPAEEMKMEEVKVRLG
jgi:putative SOS response-associated peptidase YedK